MNYSRERPSPRYFELQEQYRLMHLEEVSLAKEPTGQYFPGYSLLPHVQRIKDLIDATQAKTVLDYGSGKGQQYEKRIVDLGPGKERLTIPEFWGVQKVRCYDPGYEPFKVLPTEMFDGVITTDMVEHCPVEDLPWIVDEILSFADKFAYINAASYPAAKILPNGENAHCTIKPPEWWRALIAEIAEGHPGVLWELCVTSKSDSPTGPNIVETVFSNAEDRKFT